MNERGASLIEQKPVNVAGLDGIEMQVDLRGKPPKRSLQRAATDGGAGYLLSCNSDEALFDNEKALCQRVFESFRFLQAGVGTGR